jgi:hypothetical protein
VWVAWCAVSIGALRELISDEVDGFLANPAVEEEWTRKMVMFFTDFKWTQHMGLMDKAKVISKFSNERVASDMERLYESTLAQEKTLWFIAIGRFGSEKNLLLPTPGLRALLACKC